MIVKGGFDLNGCDRCRLDIIWPVAQYLRHNVDDDDDEDMMEKRNVGVNDLAGLVKCSNSSDWNKFSRFLSKDVLVRGPGNWRLPKAT